MEQKAGSGIRRRGRVQEESPYVKFLKYKQSGFAVSDAKNRVWVPSKDKDKVYEQAEILKDDGKTFSFRNEDGEEKTLPKDEKNYLGVNPPKFDGVEDMGELGHLNEPAVLHNLKKRYDVDLFHTYSGLFLVVVNPYKRLPIYTNEIIDIYRGRPRDKVAPHIFAISDAAYRAMIQTSTNQSMLITGESGAGKTENTKKVIQYLAAIAGRAGGQGTLEQQLLEFNPILEAFGNAKTTKNNNSSRFGKFIELQFNAGGQIAGANTLIYLLEKSRVVFQAPNERNFHIFYQFMSEAMKAEDKARLHLTRPQDFHFLNQSSTYQVAGTDDAKEFEHSKHALKILNVSEQEAQGIYETLAGILWLGNLKFDENAREVANLTEDSATALANAAELLGCNPDKLKAGLLSPKMVVGKNEVVAKQLNKAKAAASRDALAKTIYARLFNWIVHKINLVLSHPQKKAFFIGVLDISGFEIFQHNSFEQLCINYTNEKLQQFFNHHMFTLEQQEYENEKIEWSFVNYGLDLQDTIDLIEKKPMGILSILDEQTVFPDANDTTFTKKLHDAHESHRNFRKPRFVANTFQLIHYAGTVEYQTADWLEKNRDPLEDDLGNLMRQSSSNFLVGLFDEGLMPSFKLAAAGTSTAGGRSLSGGRGGPVSRTPGATFMSVATQYKEQLAHLMDTLRSTSPHFIRCILPNIEQRPGYVVNEIVLNQLKCNGVLEGIRIARKGFPNRTKYADFLKRYHLLKPGSASTSPDSKGAVKELIDFLVKKNPEHVKPDLIRFGLTKIFFRAGQLAVIEQMRETLVSGMIISVQAGVRAFLARRLYDKLREQTISAKVLQRNIRAWLELKDWAWWNLYIKARPLITQRNFQAEIDDLEKKVKELTKQLEALTAQKNKIDEARRQAEEDADKLTGELNASKQKLLDLEGEKSDLEADKDLLTKKVKNLEDEIADEAAATNELLAKIKSLEQKKAELEISLEDELKQKKNEVEARKKVEGERDEWKGKFQEEQLVAEGLKKKAEDLQRDLDKASEDLGDSEGQTEQLRSKLRKAENDLKNLNAEHDELNRSKLELEKERKRLSDELEEARRGLDENKAGKEQASENARRLQASLEEANNEISSLKNKLAGSDKNLKAAKNSERELEEQLEDEQAVRANVEKLKKALELKVEELEDKVETLEKAKTDLSNQVRNLTADKEDLSRKYDEASANASRLQKDKKNLEDDLAELENQLEAERENVRKTKRKADAQVAELEEKLAAAPASGGASAEELRKFEDQLDELTLKLRSAEAAKEDAEKDLRAANLELQDLKQQLEDADRNNQKQQNENRRLQGELAAAKEEAEKAEEGKLAADANSRRLTSELEELKRKLAKESDSRIRAEDGRDVAERDLKALKKEIEGLERKVAYAERDARDARAKNDDLRFALANESRAKEKLLDNQKDFRKLLLEREQSNSVLINNLHGANEEDKRALDSEISSLKDKNDRLSEKVVSLQGEFDNLFRKLEERKEEEAKQGGAAAAPAKKPAAAAATPAAKPAPAPATAAPAKAD